MKVSWRVTQGWSYPTPFPKGVGHIPALNGVRLNIVVGTLNLTLPVYLGVRELAVSAGTPSPYALRGGPPWGHHFPSDRCPVYLRWPTGPIGGSLVPWDPN